jgi:transposase
MTMHLNVKLAENSLYDKVRNRLFQGGWPEDEKELVMTALSLHEDLALRLKEQQISKERLQKIAFGQTSEKSNSLFDDAVIELPPPVEESSLEEGPPPPPHPPRKRSGHGLRKLQAVAHSRQKIQLENHTPGCSCTACGKGRFYRSESREKTIIHAVNLIQVQVVELETLRCNTCGTTQVADEPEILKECIGRYHPTAISLFTVLRYMMGMPSHRMETFTEMGGLRISDSTQFNLFEYALSCVRPVFDAMVSLAANGKMSFRDDSSMRVLQLRKELERQKMEDENVRIGITTTHIHAQTQCAHIVALYFTGNEHAGDVYGKLLQKRTIDSPMLAMSDGLAANRAHDAADKTHELACLVHARRNFVELAKQNESEVREVLAIFRSIYAVESHAETYALSDDDRLKLHQMHSKERMDTLIALAKERSQSHEPRSPIAA